MLTNQYDDVSEVTICRNPGAGWRVEFPHAKHENGLFVTIVSERGHAEALAAQLCPRARILFRDGSE
jgi:hypothetical protein